MSEKATCSEKTRAPTCTQTEPACRLQTRGPKTQERQTRQRQHGTKASHARETDGRETGDKTLTSSPTKNVRTGSAARPLRAQQPAQGNGQPGRLGTARGTAPRTSRAPLLSTRPRAAHPGAPAPAPRAAPREEDGPDSPDSRLTGSLPQQAAVTEGATASADDTHTHLNTRNRAAQKRRGTTNQTSTGRLPVGDETMSGEGQRGLRQHRPRSNSSASLRRACRTPTRTAVCPNSLVTPAHHNHERAR